MRLDPKRCPCGCKKIILEPVCGCQCSSVQPEVAHELMVKVNSFDDLMAALEAVVLNPGSFGLHQTARAVWEGVKKQLADPAEFPPFPWAK